MPRIAICICLLFISSLVFSQGFELQVPQMQGSELKEFVPPRSLELGASVSDPDLQNAKGSNSMKRDFKRAKVRKHIKNMLRGKINLRKSGESNLGAWSDNYGLSLALIIIGGIFVLGGIALFIFKPDFGLAFILLGSAAIMFGMVCLIFALII